MFAPLLFELNILGAWEKLMFSSLIFSLSFDFLFQELLALEEHIGSVTTALTEEQFTKCVNQSVYEARNSYRDVSKIAADDVKCSVCQVFFTLVFQCLSIDELKLLALFGCVWIKDYWRRGLNHSLVKIE